MYGVLMIDIDNTALTAEDVSLIKQAQIGGVILFGRNVADAAQVRALCDDIRYHNPDILIGVDQEGGRVARLREGFTPLPAMGRLGELFNHDPSRALSCAYDCGYLMAAEVMAVGIDLSFAPVLDRDGISQVIGDRSFHQEPQAIVALATQFMRGMKAAGMATTGKHFPGHGAIAPDSHVSEAIDTRSLDEIINSDMQPFAQTLSLLDALMPAHVIFSQVDNKPAGFSKVWLKDIIRDQLAFDGVLFSDDLSMAGAKAAGDVSARVKAAIEAGCDIALVCNDRVAAHEAAAAAQELPYPNQRRIKTMCGNIPKWQGDLESTCQQFDYWQQAKNNVTQSFFNVESDTQADKPANESKDPTDYK
ncbi:beta-N-acetylhexosaminidase [Psychrobacter pacificensis]|uniref:beta-N-acetylhexosaminidase n=1 Tax=Psychrobacter pacificensis TaxID=112002 RepID=UPI002382B8C4|nr:beta-N-acetylhexosaminidase [Psychrobacter pacificensis]MDE0843032.1 beta-N-acetylhexosaminidase [Psychrobacter pacificensis]